MGGRELSYTAETGRWIEAQPKTTTISESFWYGPSDLRVFQRVVSQTTAQQHCFENHMYLCTSGASVEVAMRKNELLKALICERSTITLVGKFMHDVLEVFYTRASPK
jgi:hypothetical protein